MSGREISKGGENVITPLLYDNKQPGVSKGILEVLSGHEQVLSSLPGGVYDRIPLHAEVEIEVQAKLRDSFRVESDEEVMDELGIDIPTNAPQY